ncbi:MAG TPA: pilus assembly protein CpaE [Nocardioidaceae bacterium]|nr:pilus assembly protein CpaE [Nocardioidaceae bacterium]
MITLDLARRLRTAGLQWTPASGDRFVVPDRDLDEEVFVISQMTIEPEQLGTGGIVRFNGTTEWALDSIAQDEVVWLPHEAQLRALLGSSFVSLEAVPDGFVVVVEYDGQRSRHLDIDAERAYARALLAVLGEPA